MIGVIADSADQDIACEFFELFKTPWEFYRENRDYDAVLCTGDCKIRGAERVILCYSARSTAFDERQNVTVGRTRKEPSMLSWQGKRIPVYGESLTFEGKEKEFLTDEGSGALVAYVQQSGERVLVRIGYDLFGEIRTLLTMGQPVGNAVIPALELHIALLRDLITSCGISLVEIPPVPEGFSFIACLTHDVDHPSFRRHKLDPTVIGFLWRAIFGSLIDIVRGWVSLRDAARNWAAAIKLPFVYLGLAKDFWSNFADRYLEVENGLPSTFFVIPRKNYAGRGIDTRAAALRAARYEAKELAETICRLTSAGCEVALHGIDAWLDSSAGREEIEEVRRLTRVSEVGVRMHWLYYNEKSPAILEKAGATYDSTIGYNETVGYRAGSTQAFKPLEAEQLLELPLHAMDTALFYVSYLGLSPKKAKSVLEQLVCNAVQYGGCVTVNWHDRSLAPERLWDAPYKDLVQDMRARGAWFATAAQTVAWFRKRRSAAFEDQEDGRSSVRTSVSIHEDVQSPRLQVRVHKPKKFNEPNTRQAESYIDMPVKESAFARLVPEIGQ